MNLRRPIITDRKIRVALVGCGRISKNHLQALRDQGQEFELVDICDSSTDALSRAEKETGLKGHSNFLSLLEKTSADLISLCTPSGLHPIQAIQAFESGKNVLTEKPMATRYQDARKMVELSDAKGLHLFVVKQNRLNPTIQLVKQAIQNGRFGRIYFVQANVFWSRPQSYYDSAKWRGTWEFDGGALMNQASHYIDLLDWLIGPVESVNSLTATLARRIEVEDTAVVGIRWRSGILGSANVTMLTYNKNLEGSILILGEKGTVKIGGLALNKIEKWEFEEKASGDDAVTSANYDPVNVYGSGHRPYYQNLADVFRGKAEAIADGREGLRSIELLAACYLSARKATRQSLPLEV